MATTEPDPNIPTRERLAEAALRIFAVKGFRDTTVGEIETAAGLAPRRGALYRHFDSKEALLDAAVETHIHRLRTALSGVVALPDHPTHAQIAQWGYWFLSEMDAQQDLFRLLEHDGERLEGLRETMRSEVIDSGHRLIASMVRQRRKEPSTDAEAVAVLVIGPLANHRRTAWTFGAPPAAVTDERLIDVWSRSVAAAMQFGNG